MASALQHGAHPGALPGHAVGEHEVDGVKPKMEQFFAEVR